MNSTALAIVVVIIGAAIGLLVLARQWYDEPRSPDAPPAPAPNPTTRK